MEKIPGRGNQCDSDRVPRGCDGGAQELWDLLRMVVKDSGNGVCMCVFAGNTKMYMCMYVQAISKGCLPTVISALAAANIAPQWWVRILKTVW